MFTMGMQCIAPDKKKGNYSMYISLIQNVALLLALATIYSQVVRVRSGKDVWTKSLLGVLFGGVAIAGMLMPLNYAPGIIYDGRSIVMAMAGLFGGGTSAVISVVIAGIFRASLGGTGVWAGLLTILCCAMTGLVFRRGYGNQPERISILSLYGVGIAVHLVMLACQLLLMPWPRGLTIIDSIWLPIMVIFPAATLLMGLILGTVDRRTQAERKLLASEALLKETQSIARIGSYEYNVSDGRLTLSEEIYRIFGFNLQEIAADYITFLECLHPDDRAAVDRTRWQSIEDGRDNYENQYSIVHLATGEVHIVREKCKYIKDASGKIIRAIGFVQDVTEQVKAERALRFSEEKFRIIFDNAMDGILLVDNETRRIAMGNKMICQMLEYSEAEIRNLSIADIHPAEDAARVMAQFEKTARNELSHAENIPVKRKNGKIFLADINASCVTIGGKYYVMGSFRDITEHKKLEAQYLHAQKMESIGTLAGGVAHDFNNILTAIIGYGQLALMKMSPLEPQRHSIESVLEAADRASRLTKELLLFSRKQVTDKKTVDLNQVVAKVEKFLKKVIGEDILCKTMLHEASLPVIADAYQLEQVLMNLATNARDSMPHGGTLTVTTEHVLLNGEFMAVNGNEGPYALLTITDSGMGMDEETRQRIFEPFFTTKEIGKGTGLGLAVAYGIIKQHEGFINVYSEPGIGTAFKIYLPLTPERTMGVTLAAKEEIVPGGKETVLLAEDDEMVRTLTSNVLTDFGYTVIEAVDGADALSKFAASGATIDLLLFDLIMPKMNGKDACDEIRKVSPGIKAIFSSGYAPDTIRQKAFLEGDLHLVSKPISPKDLLQKVRCVLDGA
jgi:PAS domain S-box-containing protein